MGKIITILALALFLIATILMMLNIHPVIVGIILLFAWIFIIISYALSKHPGFKS